MSEEIINNNQSIYVLGICELFNDSIHGFIEGQSSPEIYYHYFMRNEIQIQEFYEEFDTIKDICERLNYYYTNRICRIPYYYILHPIPNYRIIVRNNPQKKYEYIKTEIIERIFLPKGKEYIAIIKTFWLRIVQRTWKKVYSKQKEIWNQRRSIQSILNREICTRGLKEYEYYPTLRGMLSNIITNNSG